MSALIPALRNWLRGDEQIVAMVGQRIMPGNFDEDVDVPAVMMYTPYSVPHNQLDGGVGMETAAMRIECCSSSYDEAVSLWTLVNRRLMLRFKVGIYSGCSIVGISQNDGLQVISDRPINGTDRWFYRAIQTFDVSYHPWEV